MNLGAVIERAVMLRDLPAEDRAALAAAARLRRYRAGAYLWRAGDAEDGLHVLDEGFVHIGVIGPNAEEVVLHVAGPGDIIGEPSIFAPVRDCRTDGRAVGAASVVSLPGRAVRAVLEASPEAMRIFAGRVSEIARGHARRVALTAFHDARGRLAQLLLDFGETHGVPDGRGLRITLPMSQRTLAGLVGLRRESVNRLIAAFEREGALRFDDATITLLDLRSLRAALGAAENLD